MVEYLRWVRHGDRLPQGWSWAGARATHHSRHSHLACRPETWVEWIIRQLVRAGTRGGSK